MKEHSLFCPHTVKLLMCFLDFLACSPKFPTASDNVLYFLVISCFFRTLLAVTLASAAQFWKGSEGSSYFQ